MRHRDEEAPRPPLYSISRGTNVRVFVAMPVFVDNHVRGVVYASRTPDNILRQLYQDAIDRYFPMLPAFFGQSGSQNNALYRKFGIKQRSNEEMRADYVARAKELVEGHLKLTLPEIAEAA